jgi:uncharacterized protein (DUF697 family)/GTPase Era involved in 16S rRNA processing
MAVNKAHAKDLIDGINAAFESATGSLPDGARKWLRDRILGSAIGEIEKLVTESRPPVLYVMGRSGHGKSSLINALAGRQVAQVGHIKPQTATAEPYQILFEEVYAEWKVIDSRGIFESTAPDGAPEIDAVDQVVQDVKHFRPDVILHAVSAPEARTLSNDFRVFNRVQQALKKEFGTSAPSLMVLTKVDVLDDPRAWPLEKHPQKAAQVVELLDYVAKEVLQSTPERLDPNATIKGYKVSADAYVGVVPVCVRQGDEWNVSTLSDFIGRHLPESALLDYCQALQRREQLRRVSTAITRRFSTTASGIGAAPIPIADLAVLTPLQLLLVAFIAGLSCRRFSLDSAREFMAAAGVNVGAAFGAREIVRGVAKLVPTVGAAMSGAMAGATTYGIGKAAEAYFFAGETRKPSSYLPEWIRGSKRESDESLL